MTISERNVFVSKNLGLIKKISNQISGKIPNGWELKEDFQQDAAVKFLEIADRYDPSRGTKVSTFVWSHLKNHIINSNSPVPESVRRNVSKIKNVRKILSDGNNPVSDKEIADFLGCSEEKIQKIKNEENQYMNISLDYNYSNKDGKSYTLMDKIDDSQCEIHSLYSDDYSMNPEENYMKKEEKEIIRFAWSQLSDEERTILSLRTSYNSEEKEPLSLRETAAKLNSNRTTISQKEKKAQNHLRAILEEEGLCA